MQNSIDPVRYAAMTSALQESEERYRQLVDTHPDALLIHTSGQIVFVNPAMLRLLGATDYSQIVGKPVLGFLHPDSRQTVRERIEAFNAGTPVSPTCELKYLAINGEPLDVFVTASSCHWEGRAAIQVMVHDLRESRQATDALRKREAQLQGLLAHSPSVVFIKDCEGRFEFINRAYETLYAVSAEAVVGLTDYDLFPKEIADGFRANDIEVMRTRQAVEAEEVVPLDGGYGTHHSVKFPILAASGELTGVCGISTDITLRRQAEIAIAGSEARMAEAQRISRVGSWEYDVASRKIVWSEELFRQFGLDPQDGAPDADTYLTFYHPEDAELLRASGAHATQFGEGCTINLRGTALEGEMPRWYHIIVDPVFDTEGNVFRLVGTHMDITARKRIEEQLQAANEWLADGNAQLESHIARINEQTAQLEFQKAELQAANFRLEALATTDGLTGLKNHRSFQDQLHEEVERALRYGTPLSVLMLDVDRFKAYNDTFGHPAGDTVLRRVAEILQSTCRVHDFVARYGGEEFAVILTEADSERARATAERLRAAIEAEPWSERPVTASFGVATLSLTTNDTTGLIAQADAALYVSKSNGRNRVTFLGFQNARPDRTEVSA